MSDIEPNLDDIDPGHIVGEHQGYEEPDWADLSPEDLAEMGALDDDDD